MLNDERLPPGTGYATHRHAEHEIVTVVLSGRLHHVSDVGDAVLGPGDVQRLTAGSGVLHSEVSVDAGETTRFVQSWLRPSTPGLDPSYERIGGALVAGGEVLRPVDLGPGTAARLHLGQVSPGERTRLPQAPALHVLVVGGTATLTSYGEDAELRDGDAVRMRSVTEASVAVSPDASQAVSLVVWALP